MKSNVKIGLALAAVTVAGFVRMAAGEPTGCPDFTVEQPRDTKGPVLRAADFGVSTTNADNAAALNRAFEACRKAGASKLVLERGTYKCHGPVGLVLDGLTDFTFDGGDSLLVFWRKNPADWDSRKYHPESAAPEGKEGNLTVRNCRRVKVARLNLDWDWSVNPLGFFAECVGKHVDERDNESYVDFEIRGMDRYPIYPNPVPIQLIQPFDKACVNARFGKSGEATGARCYCGMGAGHFGCKNEWLSPTRLRVWVYVQQPDRPQLCDPARFAPRLNRGAVSGFDVGGMFNVSHYYYGMNGISLTSNEHLTLSDVWQWSCRGAGLVIGGGEKYTLLERVRLAAPTPEEVKARGAGGAYPRPFTATADGTHVQRSLGYVKLVGCEWEMHNDDSVNFHDCTSIARKVGPRTLSVVNNFGVSYLAVKPGSTVELRQEDYALTGWRGKVVKADQKTFEVDRDLPEQKGIFFVVFNLDYSTSNLLFKDCLFHRTPWARNLILGSNVTFDGCRFEDTLGSPLRFQACYTYNVWCEGSGCTNVVVRNCTFKNCADAYKVNGISSQIYMGVRIPGYHAWPEYGVRPVQDAWLAKEIEKRDKIGAAGYPKPCADAIGNFLIEGNVFINPAKYLLYAYNGTDIILRNNKVVFDGTAPYGRTAASGKVKLGDASGVKTDDPSLLEETR